MKRKEIAAFLAISIGALGLLSACGVYGPAEPVDDVVQESEYLNSTEANTTETITTEAESPADTSIDSEVDEIDPVPDAEVVPDDDYSPGDDEVIAVYGPEPEEI